MQSNSFLYEYSLRGSCSNAIRSLKGVGSVRLEQTDTTRGSGSFLPFGQFGMLFIIQDDQLRVSCVEGSGV